MIEVKKLIFVSSKIEDMPFAAYIEQMANKLDAAFERHDLEDIIKSPVKLTPQDQWIFFSWPVSNPAKLLLADLKISYYLLYEGEQAFDEEFHEHLENDTNLISPIDSTRDCRFHIPLLRNREVCKSDDERKKLLEVGDSLNQMIEFSLEELQKMKKIHEQVVPMKNDTFKGIKILSKFAAGSDPGGEFFDIVKGEQELLLLLTNTSSYVASSIILSHFEKLRAYSLFTEERILNFFSDLSSEIKELGLFKDGADPLHLLLVKIDLNKMTFEGFQFGNTEIISSRGHVISSNTYPVGKVFAEKAEFKFDLERGERLVIASPGVRKNCNGLLGNKNYNDFIKERLPLGARELLNEVYFQLKKNLDSDFLKYDASLIYIEVDKNAIIEI